MKKQTLTTKELELLKRHVNKDRHLFSPEKYLFKEQLSFYNDPSQYVVACCSRRAGKSYAIAVKLIATALNHPRGLCAYITLSKTSARLIIFDTLTELLEDSSIDAHINQHEQIITFPNKSKIVIYGAKDTSEIEKLRGIKLRLCCIDEAQSFKYSIIYELATNILPPALGDYQAQLIVTGTPSLRCAGIFYLMYTNKGGYVGYSSHHWTLRENIKFPAFISNTITYEDYIAGVIRVRGISKHDPAFLREYLGKFVEDASDIVVNIPDSGRLDDLIPSPQGSWTYYCSIDTGFRDNWAITVLATSETDRTAYVVSSREYDLQGFSVMIEKIKSLNDIYSFRRIVVDGAETGLHLTAEVWARHSIRIMPADKQNKDLYLSLLSDDFRNGGIKVYEPACEELLYQCDNLCWDYNAIGERKLTGIIDSVKRDHALHSLLYCYRLAKHFRSTPVVTIDSEEAVYKAKVEAHKEGILKRAIQKERNKQKSIPQGEPVRMF